MIQRRPPPLAIELDRSVQAACRREPSLTALLNAVLLRASRRLRARTGAGDGALEVAGRREGLVLSVMLAPPDVCRVTGVRRLVPGEEVAADIVV